MFVVSSQQYEEKSNKDCVLFSYVPYVLDDIINFSYIRLGLWIVSSSLAEESRS